MTTPHPYFVSPDQARAAVEAGLEWLASEDGYNEGDLQEYVLGVVSDLFQEE